MIFCKNGKEDGETGKKESEEHLNNQETDRFYINTKILKRGSKRSKIMRNVNDTHLSRRGLRSEYWICHYCVRFNTTV